MIWWAKHIVACAGEIGLFAFAGVKVVAGAIKFVKWVKGLKSTSAVAKAWNQLMKHGKGGGTFAKLGSDFAKFANTVIDLLKKLAKSGWKAMKAYAKTSAARVAVLTLMAAATATAAEWIGLGNCYAVVKAI